MWLDSGGKFTGVLQYLRMLIISLFRELDVYTKESKSRKWILIWFLVIFYWQD